MRRGRSRHETADDPAGPVRIAFVLPGLHRVERGAETAFEATAHEMGLRNDCDVTVFGSGGPRPHDTYRFVRVPCWPRERFEGWPRVPGLRDDTAYEELTFAARLWRRYNPDDFDVTIACSYPYCNWVLRTKKCRGSRPVHLFVTQNGDWAPQARNREFRYFACDGLVCTNPEYFQRNKDRWPTVLIPNGVDPEVFHPGPSDRARFDLPVRGPIVLMVSALIRSKRVLEGIEVVASLDGVNLVVAGDGPLRTEVELKGQHKLGKRFRRLLIPRQQMPDLYRCADAFLHMSLDEPSANAYIEALASGLPIVTHDRQVTRWTLEDCGSLIDTRDGDAAAAALTKALGCDRHAAADRNRALVDRRFCWRHLAEAYIGFIHEILPRDASPANDTQQTPTQEPSRERPAGRHT